MAKTSTKRRAALKPILPMGPQKIRLEDVPGAGAGWRVSTTTQEQIERIEFERRRSTLVIRDFIFS